jgi:hypothetical protein
MRRRQDDADATDASGTYVVQSRYYSAINGATNQSASHSWTATAWPLLQLDLLLRTGLLPGYARLTASENGHNLHFSRTST